MRGTPQWDVSVDRGDYGEIRDRHGIRVVPCRRAILETGLCEVITCDAYGNRQLRDDQSGPETHYQRHDPPLTFTRFNGFCGRDGHMIFIGTK